MFEGPPGASQWSLRLAMTVHSTESVAVASSKLTKWVETFSDLTGAEVPSCLWVTGTPKDDEHARVGAHCVHSLFLHPEVDRYVRNWNPRTPWSPWGQKSGPNFQFFEVLRQAADAHSEDWLLQLETDVEALRLPRPDDFGDKFKDSWVVGAKNHSAVRQSLDVRLWEHINGAAFYRVGDSEFRAFLEEVWKPSLLFLLSAEPTIAYDCMTSPAIWGELPEPLKNRWWSARDRFVRLPGMINGASLTRHEAGAALRGLSDGPWLFHGKITEQG
jgi:hypothetical protein